MKSLVLYKDLCFTKSAPEYGSMIFSIYFLYDKKRKKNFSISKCWKFCRTTLTFLFQFYKKLFSVFSQFSAKSFQFLVQGKKLLQQFLIFMFFLFYRIQFTRCFSINFLNRLKFFIKIADFCGNNKGFIIL